MPPVENIHSCYRTTVTKSCCAQGHIDCVPGPKYLDTLFYSIPREIDALLFIHSFFLSFIHSFITSFIHSLLHSLLHSFILYFIHSFFTSFIHLLLHSFIHSLLHSFIHSFNHRTVWVLNPLTWFSGSSNMHAWDVGGILSIWGRNSPTTLWPQFVKYLPR